MNIAIERKKGTLDAVNGGAKVENRCAEWRVRQFARGLEVSGSTCSVMVWMRGKLAHPERGAGEKRFPGEKNVREKVNIISKDRERKDRTTASGVDESY